MKYPKLWNGASPVGEALVRALQRSNAPYLSSATADGITANKMGGRSEVFQSGGEGGFISRPTWGTYTSPQFYATGSGPFAQFKPIIKQGMSRAIPVYQARFGKAPNYGTVDWQGNGPDKVLSWHAASWVGLPQFRYDFNNMRIARSFYDTTRSNVFFLQPPNFADSTWEGRLRNFDTPTIRYQCVGNGLQVYRNMRLWRELREDQRLSEYEYIQGATITSHNDVSGCFVILREVNIPSFNGTTADRTFRAGWLSSEGVFQETHRYDQGFAYPSAQCWYFNKTGSRAVSVDGNGECLQFSHETGFSVIEPWVNNDNFTLGRDLSNDQLLSLDRMATPHPNYDFVGKTLVKDVNGAYQLTEWTVPAMRWDSNGTNWPHFTARALGADLRSGTLVVIEHAFSPAQGEYSVPFEISAGTNKPVALSAALVIYQHGTEVARQPINLEVAP